MLHWAKMFLASSAAFLMPPTPLMVGTLVLVMLDSVTGVGAAWKVGEKITSAKLRNTVTKALIYSLALIACFVAEKNLLGGMVPASKFAAGAIGIVELKSILENASKALGAPIFQVLMSKLGSANVNPKDDAKDEPTK